MGQLSIFEFYSCIGSHLDEAQRLWRETGCRTAATPGTLARSALEGSSTDYIDALRDVHRSITGMFSSKCTRYAPDLRYDGSLP